MIKQEEFKKLYEAWTSESERDKVYQAIAKKYTDWSNSQLEKKLKELESRETSLKAEEKTVLFEIRTEMKKRGLFGPF